MDPPLDPDGGDPNAGPSRDRHRRRPRLGGHRPRRPARGSRPPRRHHRRRDALRGAERGRVHGGDRRRGHRRLLRASSKAIEREIDRLDERALRRRPRNDVLARIVALRRRIGLIRRTLAPHRVAFAALARPEMELHEELGRPWPGLTDRLERTIDAVENLRDLLLGTFDIHMGRAAQDANDVMKVLTLLSAVLLPSVVLAGIMGMNFNAAVLRRGRATSGSSSRRWSPSRVGAWSSRRAGGAGSEPGLYSSSSVRANPNSAPPPSRGTRPDPTAHRGDQSRADEQPDPGTARRHRRSPASGRRVRTAGSVSSAGKPGPSSRTRTITSLSPVARRHDRRRPSRSTRRRRTSRRSTAGCAGPVRRRSGRP